MPYSFSQHMEQLADDPKMQDLVIRYYNAFGHDVADELESQPFYTNYIQFFRPLGSKLRVPKGLEDQFNWDLFCQFAAASVSTQVSLERNPDNSNQIQMGISAKHEKADDGSLSTRFIAGSCAIYFRNLCAGADANGAYFKGVRSQRQ